LAKVLARLKHNERNHLIASFIITDMLYNEKIAIRSFIGYFLFVPVGETESTAPATKL